MSAESSRPSGLSGTGASCENARPADAVYPPRLPPVKRGPRNRTRSVPATRWPSWTDLVRFTATIDDDDATDDRIGKALDPDYLVRFTHGEDGGDS